jgi:hypothetical protein
VAVPRGAWTDDSGNGTSGEVINNASLQAIYDDFDAVVTYGCRAYHSTTQSISNAVFTAVLFNSEDYDTGGFHSTVTNTSRFTVPSGAGGLYLITANILFAANATGQRVLQVRLNGGSSGIAAIIGQQIVPSATYSSVVMVASILTLNAGDYVEVFAYQDSGGALNIGTATAYTSNGACFKRLG